MIGTEAAAGRTGPGDNYGGRYTYVVIGGGTAGCVLASRLSEDPSHAVLLLEAGDATPGDAIDRPGRWIEATGTAIDWCLRSVPQSHAGGRSLAVPRGKTLGGSSVINALVHHAGVPEDYDSWEASGAEGWGWAAMAPLFRTIEDWRGPPDPRRGTGGPVIVTQVGQPSSAVERFMQGAERAGYARLADLNAAPATGVSPNQLAFDGRHRMSAYRAYLRPVLGRSNLTVRTGASVLGLEIVAGRCVAVRYGMGGKAYRSVVECEAILAAGAIHTPQILMLSGIGCGVALRQAGIRTILDLPGVGKNLHEHILIAGHTIETAHPLPQSLFMGTDAVLYASAQRGGGARDVMLNFGTGLSADPDAAHGCRTSFSFLKPRSRGSISLRTRAPRQPPLIDPNMFADPADLAGARAALDISRAILNGPAFADIRIRETAPGNGCRGHAEIRAFLLGASVSFGHWAGSCRMGSDPEAVVDASLRVRGLDNVRVADASVMPEIPAAPTNATVLALAERASQLARAI